MTRADAANGGRGGRLSIVATPIGNIEDITLRALRTLREADLVLAEDTRRTRVLCQAHGISKPLRAFHAHSSPREVERALAELSAGQHLALVTDAGTPLISDPGAQLVRAAQTQGVQVEAIPGPSAVTAAVTVAGIACDAFRFLGFLPRSGKHRRAALAEIARDRGATVIFESPRRLLATLAELAELLGAERELAVCRELTKVHEEVARGSAQTLVEHFADGVLGEVTLVIAGRSADAPDEAAESADDLDARIAAMLATGASVRDTVRALASTTSLSKHALYALVQASKSADASDEA